MNAARASIVPDRRATRFGRHQMDHDILVSRRGLKSHQGRALHGFKNSSRALPAMTDFPFPWIGVGSTIDGARATIQCHLVGVAIKNDLSAVFSEGAPTEGT